MFTVQNIPSSIMTFDVEQAVLAKCQSNYGKWGLFEHNGYISTMGSETQDDRMPTNQWIHSSQRLAKVGIHRDNNQCRLEV